MAHTIQVKGYVIDDSEISESFTRSSGPGGQNVNKVSTAVELRFKLGENTSLPVDARARLFIDQARRINKDGELVIFAQTHRSQDRNRSDARARLSRMIEAALIEPKTRLATKPSKASKLRRLDAKNKASETKSRRSRVIDLG